jgi:hypothetical protein
MPRCGRTRKLSRHRQGFYREHKTQIYHHIIKLNLFIVVVVVVVVVSVPPHFEISWKKVREKFEKINFETSRGLLMCYCIYISQNRTATAQHKTVIMFGRT